MYINIVEVSLRRFKMKLYFHLSHLKLNHSIEFINDIICEKAGSLSKGK